MAFSRAHCTCLLIPRASLCFSKWNTRCCSEVGCQNAAKEALSERGCRNSSVGNMQCKKDWIASILSREATCLWINKEHFLHLQEPIPVWIEGILNCRWNKVCCPCYILCYNVWVFSSTTAEFFFLISSWLRHCLHKQYKVRYINNSKWRGKARIIVCQSLVLRLPDYVSK